MNNQNLENRIKALEKWRDERINQQIVYPLDINSRIILDKYYMHIIGSLVTVNISGDEFIDYIGKQDNTEFIVSKNQYIPYTVNTATDTLSIDGYIEDNRVVYFVASGTIASPGVIPTPLVDAIGYYVINSTGKTFQVSATLMGAAINITSTGTGRQFYYSYGF